ncbi:MAG: small multi-drug export protein [archaeon]|nr:MAG: small multi-drug export protein [archaeon]
MNALILSMILSFVPISELRLAIPLAIASNVNPFIAFIACLAINLLVAPFVFFALDKIYTKVFKKSLREHGIIQKLSKKKITKKVEKYGFMALVLFVAVPLPVTGAWTGSLVAWILGLNEKKSILAISIGITIAAVIVTLASIGVFSLI